MRLRNTQLLKKGLNPYKLGSSILENVFGGTYSTL
jgi:hypothetical protein